MMMLMTMAGAIAAAMPAAPAPVRGCRPYVAGAGMADGARIGAMLQRDWPTAWRSRDRLADTALLPVDLARSVALLACLATWPGQEATAIKAATPLFGSRRHGAAAFAAADALARGAGVSGPMRAAAHGFRARMVHAVALAYDRL